MGPLILPYVILPTNSAQLTSCYLVWIVPYLTINVVWDISTKRTERFHLAKIQSKVFILHHAAFLCSSILIISALLTKTMAQLSDDGAIPLVLASISGILQAIPGLCPYELDKPDLVPSASTAANTPSIPAIQAAPAPHP